MKNLVSLLLLAIFSLPAFSQSISIFDIDTTNFPTMQAKFYAFDKDGNIQRPSANELILKENGVVRTIKSVNCPATKPPVAISSVLVMDVSGSMQGGNMDLAKFAAKKWVNNLNMNTSESAITSFDNANYLNQDFTNGRTRLLSAIETLQPMGGTNYDAALINQLAGGLLVTKRAKYKKIIIFLSDGMPGSEPNTNQIVAEAKTQNCTIYCVSLGMKAPNSMREMAKQTGGEYFEEITNQSEIEKVYNMIYQRATEVFSCGIEWESGINCNSNFTNLELQWQNSFANSSYNKPISTIAKLVVEPDVVSFKQYNLAIRDTTITIIAVNSDFNIIDIKQIIKSDLLSFPNLTFPINIPKNTSKQLTLRFAPIDSSYTYASFEIITDLCPAALSSNGGFIGKKLKQKTLKLIKPNGGEEFVVGKDTIITWEGISKSDTVTLEYSIDSGKTWQLITNTATGLSYNWKNIQKPTSKNCLVRVNQMLSKLNDSIITLVGHSKNYSDDITSIKFDKTGTRLVSGSEEKKAILWDINNLNQIKYKFDFEADIYDVDFNPDGSKIVVAGDSQYLKMWDVNTGQLEFNKIISSKAYKIEKFEFSPDGNKASFGYWGERGQIRDANSFTFITDLNYKGVNTIIDFCFSPDSKYLGISAANDSLRILDVETGKSKISISIPDSNSSSLAIAFNLSGDKLLSSHAIDSNIYIWNLNNGQLFDKINLGEKNNYFSFAYNSKNLVAIKTYYNEIELWDIESHNLYKKIKTKRITGYRNTIKFSPDGSLLAFAGDSNSIIIWNLNTETNQSDVSDSVFSIVAPTPLGRDVDMKECFVAAVKDTVVSDFMQNVGSYRFRTDSIYFSGADASAFQLVSGIPRYELEPGKTKFAELRFMPKRVGNHTAKINIIAGGDTLIYNITGVGVQPMLQLINNIIDFGKIKVGASKDSIQASTIKNTGTVPITITKTSHAGPNDVDFTTLSGAAPFTLQPGETAKMNLRFNAKSRGRTSGQLKFEYNGVGSPAVVQLFAEGLPADTNCEGRSFVFRNFNLTSQVVKNGNSFITPDSTIRLTESKSNEVGGISYSEKVSLLSSFVMKFSFRFSNGVNSFMDGSLPGADGLAVLFQNGRGFRTTENGGSLGYNGIINCVALEVDMYRNSDFNDPNGNHVALQIPYKDTITSEHNAQRTFKMNENIFVLRSDSTVYYGLVKFDANKKHLEFYLDSNKSANNLVMAVDDFDFSRHLKLEYGDFAYIGITGSTGASVQTHEILSWEFCSDRDEVLSVENGFYESEELVQNENILKFGNSIITSVKINDQLGRVVFNEKVNQTELNLNIFNLANGMYYLTIIDENGRCHFKKVSIVK